MGVGGIAHDWKKALLQSTLTRHLATPLPTLPHKGEGSSKRHHHLKK